jgi:hypothetical protein
MYKRAAIHCLFMVRAHSSFPEALISLRCTPLILQPALRAYRNSSSTLSSPGSGRLFWYSITAIICAGALNSAGMIYDGDFGMAALAVPILHRLPEFLRGPA